MKIFIVTNCDTELAPFISLENAYKEMERNREYFSKEDFPTFEEIKKLYEVRKAKGLHLYHRLSTSNEEFNMYIEEFTLNP